jgi:hypothetical protein
VVFRRLGVTGRFRVMSGSGVALLKSRCSGCEQAAGDRVVPLLPSQPTSPERPAWRTSACNRVEMASLMRRLRDRSASLPVLPSAILRS